MSAKSGTRTELRVGVRQQQRLTLTPQVRQTIEMLVLPLTELRVRVQQELLQNPALEEVVEEEEEDSQSEDAETEGESDAEDGAADDDPDPMAEIEAEDFFQENQDNTGGLALGEEPPALERTLAAGRTLAQHLIEQLGPSVATELERTIGLAIIGNLDERGYLDASVAEIAAAVGVPEDQVEAMRRRILRFDPTGVAALDLAECLLAQLEAAGQSGGPLGRIVREHLDLVIRERFRELARAMGAEVTVVMRWVRRIGELDFRPGSQFAPGPEQIVVPDARAYLFNGEWRVEMSDGIPKLRTSPAYRAVLKSPDRHTPQEQAFAREAWVRAKGFQRSVQQRQETVRLVAEDIVRKQAEFLNRGIAHIRPLVLNDVAQDIGRAESTVSRVVSNKFLETPRGVIPFRRFFHSALSLRDGRQVSSEAVRARVRRIVEREDPEHPLADDQIVQLLDRAGIMIARRTVAKYRKSLRIPSSNERRARYRNRAPGRTSDSRSAGG
ncbi:MAG: RNA polymerase factor sigma-54 [Acidobacteria bacterium]|nr:RNA polymerase factor sigma-54 [Acidobacteriota bacterium]